MLDSGTFVVFVPAALALILAPGPDTFYVLTRALGHGRAVGVAAAAGISAGVVVHTVAAALGLSVLLRESALAFRVVKYLGAVYLLYLGVEALRSPERFEFSGGDGSPGGDATGSRASFARGVLVNALNPKVALFFLAFLPQFVTATGSTVQFLTLGGTYSALTLCYLAAVASFAGTVRRVLTGRPSVERALRRATGAVFVGLAVQLAVEERFGV